MPIEQELLQFARTRPGWQQDLIRRICIQSELVETDIDSALAHLKSSYGLGEASSHPILRDEHVAPPTKEAGAPVTLASLSAVHGANHLAPDQVLSFGNKGITLIYGFNGSGKTGYARIIKQVCRARREKPEALLGNVYEVAAKPAEAKITYMVGSQQREFDWRDGKPAPPELSKISVFDAVSAPLYADHQNVIDVLPWGLDVLPSLGRACMTVAQRIETEIVSTTAALSAPTPEQIKGSVAEILVQRLRTTSSLAELPTEQEIRKEGRWSETDDNELNRIEGEIKKFSEPAKAAAQYRRFKASLDALKNSFLPIASSLSKESIDKFRAQAAKTAAAREAASLAAKTRFDEDPLGAAVGTAAWRTMYEIAEQFSEFVYPGEAFPSTGVGRVCVLCQQPYGESAASRMARFKQFIEDRSQQEAKKELAALSEFIDQISEIRPPTSGEINLHLAELLASEPDFAAVKSVIDRFAAECAALAKSLLNDLKQGTVAPSPAGVDAAAMSSIARYASELENRAKEFDLATVDTEAISKLRSEHKELLSRRQLSASLAAVLWRRAEVEKLDKLRRCRQSCDTTQISKKNSEFREKYLTAGFEKALREEVNRFGLTHLPIRIDARSERGSSYVGVALKKFAPVRNSNVLSEGEFRALALACFFAEIANMPHQNGIVVDDPVSSLDHRHMRQVAQRLVLEANLRSQVVVFTHDLSFYYELWSAAAEAAVPIHRSWVRHIPPHRIGVVTPNDGPWQVKKTKERLAFLNEMLLRMPDAVPPEQQAKHVGEFYSRLRETWERLVEERLLNGVVGRFQPGVQTQSLKGVTVTDADYKAVFFNMKKASEFSGHDWATAREGSLPTKSEMAQDLAIAKAYEAELARRAEQMAKQRRSLEDPPAA
jgi:energy-coupling factor transporter ATP-binding protein EcfA2